VSGGRPDGAIPAERADRRNRRCGVAGRATAGTRYQVDRPCRGERTRTKTNLRFCTGRAPVRAAAGIIESRTNALFPRFRLRKTTVLGQSESRCERPDRLRPALEPRDSPRHRGSAIASGRVAPRRRRRGRRRQNEKKHRQVDHTDCFQPSWRDGASFEGGWAPARSDRCHGPTPSGEHTPPGQTSQLNRDRVASMRRSGFYGIAGKLRISPSAQQRVSRAPARDRVRAHRRTPWNLSSQCFVRCRFSSAR